LSAKVIGNNCDLGSLLNSKCCTLQMLNTSFQMGSMWTIGSRVFFDKNEGNLLLQQMLYFSTKSLTGKLLTQNIEDLKFSLWTCTYCWIIIAIVWTLIKILKWIHWRILTKQGNEMIISLWRIIFWKLTFTRFAVKFPIQQADLIVYFCASLRTCFPTASPEMVWKQITQTFVSHTYLNCFKNRSVNSKSLQTIFWDLNKSVSVTSSVSHSASPELCPFSPS
jgi:hypothetical protein